MERTGRRRLSHYVWYGIILAIAASLVLGASIWLVYGILEETLQILFEAVASFIAVAVLSSMIYWMAIRGKNLKEEMERHVETVASRGAIYGLVLTSFVFVFREGLEIVLFLTPFLLSDSAATVMGMAAGTLTALLMAYAIFKVGMKINLHRFFYFTSILLILLAGGLVGYGTHEFLEYFEKIGFEGGWLAQTAYTLNIPASSPFHHNGIIGSIFSVMFGYTVRAEWARIIAHFAYLAIALPLVVWVYRKNIRKA